MDKASALLALKDEGPVSVRRFAGILRDRGFWVPGPRKGWNILDRLRAQGLVGRSREPVMIRYDLPTRAGVRSVERRAAVVGWDITEKGRKRLEWLQTHRKRR